MQNYSTDLFFTFWVNHQFHRYNLETMLLNFDYSYHLGVK
jgi:hypothetical protein